MDNRSTPEKITKSHKKKKGLKRSSAAVEITVSAKIPKTALKSKTKHKPVLKQRSSSKKTSRKANSSNTKASSTVPGRTTDEEKEDENEEELQGSKGKQKSRNKNASRKTKRSSAKLSITMPDRPTDEDEEIEKEDESGELSNKKSKSTDRTWTPKSPQKRKSSVSKSDDVHVKSNHFTTLVNLLKACLIDHRWEEAGSVLASMCMYPSPTHLSTGIGMPGHQLIWTCGIEVIYNHTNTSYTDVSLFHRKRQQLDHVVSQHQSLLEHIFYLLSEQKYKEAYEVITRKVHFRKSKPVYNAASTQAQYIQDTLSSMWKDLVTVYTGLIEYMLWYQAGSQHSQCTQRDANKYWENAIMHLGSLSDKPGVWDIFVTRHIELLCGNDLLDEAIEVARKYFETNPDNPNSSKYLYHALKSKKGIPVDTLAEVLKNVITRNPSDELVLEYVKLVRDYDDQLHIPALFNMLDYACWKNDTQPWGILAEELQTIYTKPSSSKVVHLCWSDRETWWPDYHFDPLHASQWVQHDRELAIYKTVVAVYLMGPDCEFVEEIITAFQIQKRTKYKTFSRISEAKKSYREYQTSVTSLC